MTSKWLAVATMATLLVGLSCENSSESSGPSNGALSADEALCQGYCTDLVAAGCSGCSIGCDRMVASLGDCVEPWRAMTECITEVGFTCTDNRVFPKQDSCRELMQNHAECLQTRAGAGGN
jgi:hypothetical protein